MKIVDWETLDKRGELTDIEPKIANKERKQIFKTLLQREIEERWTGKVCRSETQYEKTLAPRVEIRKRLGDANVLMTVGIKAGNNWKPTTGEVVTLVSMNGTAQLTSDDFVEMNLAGTEARGMYDAVIAKDNEK